MSQRWAVQALPVGRAPAAAHRVELDKESVSAKASDLKIGAVGDSNAKGAKCAKIARAVEVIVVSSDDDKEGGPGGINPTGAGEDVGVRLNAVAWTEREEMRIKYQANDSHWEDRLRNPDNSAPVRANSGRYDHTIGRRVWRRGNTSFESFHTGDELLPTDYIGIYRIGRACASAHNGAAQARNREERHHTSDSSDSESS